MGPKKLCTEFLFSYLNLILTEPAFLSSGEF